MRKLIAILFVLLSWVSNSQTFTYRAYDYYDSQNATNPWSCNKPSGTAQYDIMIAIIMKASAYTTSGPSGWVRIAQKQVSTYYCEIWYKVAGGSEGSSYSWYNGNTGHRTYCIIASLYGNFDSTSTANAKCRIIDYDYTTTNTSIIGGSVSCCYPDCPIIWLGFVSSSVSRTITMPSSPITITEDVDRFSSAGNPFHLYIGHGQATNSQALGTLTGTLSASVSTKTAFVMALMPNSITTTFSNIETISDATIDYVESKAYSGINKVETVLK